MGKAYNNGWRTNLDMLLENREGLAKHYSPKTCLVVIGASVVDSGEGNDFLDEVVPTYCGRSPIVVCLDDLDELRLAYLDVA